MHSEAAGKHHGTQVLFSIGSGTVKILPAAVSGKEIGPCPHHPSYHGKTHQAAVDMIIELEGLTASEQEQQEAMELVCSQNHMTFEQMKPYITEEFTAAVKRSVLTGKVMELLRNTAVIEE